MELHNEIERLKASTDRVHCIVSLLVHYCHWPSPYVPGIERIKSLHVFLRESRRESQAVGSALALVGFINDTRDVKAGTLVGVSRFDCSVTSANFIPTHLNNDGSAGANRRLTRTQKDKVPTLGSVRGARVQSTNGTSRNVVASHRSSKTDAVAQISNRMWTRVSRSPDSGSVCRTVSAASCLYPSIHKNASFGYSTTGRSEKPAMGPDRTDQKQEGGGCNIGVALQSVKTFKVSTNHQKLVSVIKRPVKSSYESMQSRSQEQKRTVCLSVARPCYRKYDSIRVSHLSHKHVSNLHKTLEWKPKPPMTTIVTVDASSELSQMGKTGRSSPPTALLVSIEAPTELISNLEGLKLLDEPPVFIPEHLRVPDAECNGLNFGSFDTDFESSFSTGLNDCDCLVVEDAYVSSQSHTVQPLSSSMADGPPVDTNRPSHPHNLSSSSAETSSACSDAVLSMLPTAGGQTDEISKPEIATQGRHFSFVSSSPTDDEGLGLGGPQLQYLYDIAESQPEEVPRPTFVPFADPSPKYISPTFRPGFDVETRFQFLPSHSGSKFGGNSPSTNVQAFTSSSQESQNAGMPRTTPAVGQPSIPIHAYAGAQPTGVSVPPYPPNIYSYQYVPSNYAYMHAPYQTSYAGNSGYLQPPVGSTFSPSGRVYPSASSATGKFPLPQYKLGIGSTPHTVVAAGYGSYQTTPSGFAGTNSSVTSGIETSYDDTAGPPYKENAFYTTSPQVDASALWVQSRDLSGMQANTFYNVHGPGQHTGYMPSHAAHSHHATGFASYSQSAPTPPNHQLLQQPHALGNLGSLGAGSHAVMFSQPQRGPLNWASSYSSFIRSQ
ncbi:hypothetical protein GOP47_0007745 [Adiantum capillus-veneris]|uniref:Uncharacterized protein n=1 Tax=Adiantum capillus-veneris TaxID=13818 RepID=A0A9D4ZLU0_ADICA|nr:hypothetical protein GOP47_0007745 [Adiantum capillus-veneris]